VTPVDFSESEVQCSFASFNVVREESIFLIMTDACPPVHLAVMTVFKKVFCLLHNLQVLVFSLTGGSRSPTPIFENPAGFSMGSGAVHYVAIEGRKILDIALDC